MLDIVETWVFHEFFKWRESNSFQAEDYIDDILNGESYADSLKYDPNTMGDVRIKEEPQVFTEADARDRQKKDNHNMSKLDCFL